MIRRYLLAGCVLALSWLALGLAVLPAAEANPAGASLYVTVAGSGGACTQAEPCDLQSALGLAVDGDAIYIAGGTYTGTGEAVIDIRKGVALYGGWDGATEGPVLRDAAANASILDGEYSRRAVFISGSFPVTLDGFVVARGNASLLLSGICPAGSAGCGGGIFVENAQPLISNNVITGNIAAITNAGFSLNQYAYGGGIFLSDCSSAVITGNLVVSNLASSVVHGWGGGIAVAGGGNSILIANNHIVGNASTTAENKAGSGAGVWSEGAAPTIHDNVVERNRNMPGGGGRGAAFGAYGIKMPYVGVYDGNTIRNNQGQSAIGFWGHKASVTRNLLVDNDVAIGIDLYQSGLTPVLNNVVARSGSTSIWADGSGLFVGTSTVRLEHNTLVGNGVATGVDGRKAIFHVTNNTIVSHSVAITGFARPDVTILPAATLFFGNVENGVTGTAPVFGDPDFVDPAAGDFHLGPGSAAINRGVPTSIVDDLDRNPRDPLPDIGAYEYPWPGPFYRAALPVVVRQ